MTNESRMRSLVKLLKGVLAGFAVEAALIETACFVIFIFYFDGRCF